MIGLNARLNDAVAQLTASNVQRFSSRQDVLNDNTTQAVNRTAENSVNFQNQTQRNGDEVTSFLASRGGKIDILV